MTLEERAKRMDRILREMAAKQAAEHPERFAGKVSRQLRKQLNAIERLPPEALEVLLDLLESSLPSDFQDLLEQSK